MNNIKEKLRFLAQYPKQSCIITEGGARHETIVTHDCIEGVDYVLGKVICERVNWDPSQITLLLKDVKNISDEDALGVCKVYGDYSSHLNLGKYLAESVMKLSDPSSAFIYQYLQARGYALPWMGLSIKDLIKAEWIKIV